MKIQMTNYDTTVTWEVDHDDVGIDEVLQGVISCLRGLTWLEDTIFKGFKEATEDYDEYTEIRQGDVA